MVIGAAETVRGLAAIGRVALGAPIARVVGGGLVAAVARNIVLHAHIVIVCAC